MKRGREVCGERMRRVGWVCNRPADHPRDYHEFHDPGTSRGDDKTVEWEVEKP